MKGCINLAIGITLLILVFNWLSDNWTYVLVGLAIISAAYLTLRYLTEKRSKENILSDSEQTPMSHEKREYRSLSDQPISPLGKTPLRLPSQYTAEFQEKGGEINEVHCLLDTPTAIYLSDILSQINLILQSLPISPVEPDDTSFNITTKEQRILSDLKTIAGLLELDMDQESRERNILISAFTYYLLTPEQYSDLLDSRQRLSFLLTYYHSFPILQSQAINEHQIALREPALKEYLVKLKEIITLITTIDGVLTGKEKEVLDIYNSLTRRNFKKNIPITKPYRF